MVIARLHRITLEVGNNWPCVKRSGSSDGRANCPARRVGRDHKPTREAVPYAVRAPEIEEQAPRRIGAASSAGQSDRGTCLGFGLLGTAETGSTTGARYDHPWQPPTGVRHRALLGLLREGDGVA